MDGRGWPNIVGVPKERPPRVVEVGVGSELEWVGL